MLRMARRLVLGCLAFVLLGALSPPAAQIRPAAAENVDLLLVLAADVSRSVDDQEFELQRQGYAQAFADPRVLRAIKSGQYGKIAVAYVEWSGEWAQQVVIDWTVVSDEESSAYFANALMTKPRPFAERTALGVAIDFAAAQFKRSGHQSTRRTIDVSGDGTNTNGRLPDFARDDAVAAGITINGLVILSPEPQPFNPWHTHPPGGLDNYFREHVIGGPGAFLMVVEDFSSFAFAITNKLVREIAGEDGPTVQYALRAGPERPDSTHRD